VCLGLLACLGVVLGAVILVLVRQISDEGVLEVGGRQQREKFGNAVAHLGRRLPVLGLVAVETDRALGVHIRVVDARLEGHLKPLKGIVHRELPTPTPTRV
jgi:hypothetical protein